MRIRNRKQLTGLYLFLLLVFVGLLVSVLYIHGQSQGERPELHPKSLILSPPSPVSQGAIVTISSLIANTGEGVIGEIAVEFSYRPKPTDKEERWVKFAKMTLPALMKGEKKEAKGELDTIKLNPGIYDIRVVVDPDNQIPEQDETNNELITSLMVQPPKLKLPDLLPMGISFIDVTFPVARGDRVAISTEILNAGDKAAGPFVVKFFYRLLAAVPPQEIEFAAVEFEEGLSAGERKETKEIEDVILDTRDLTAGVYLIKVVVDPPDVEHPIGQVEEQNEDNNEITTLLTIQAVDLCPSYISFLPMKPVQEETVTVTARIEKTPKREVVEGFNVVFLVDGLQFAQVSVPGMKEDEAEKEVSATLNTAALKLAVGTHKITVIVDPENKIAEQDEANNQLTTSLTLLPAPPRLAELRPRSLQLNPPSPVELERVDKIIISSEIVNTGNAAAERFTVEFSYRLVGRLYWITIPCVLNCIIEKFSPEMSPVEAKGELDLANLALGPYEIRVAVDPDNQVTELDEFNNELVTTLRVLSPRKPDLFLKSVSFEPQVLEVRRGQVIKVIAEVINIGDADSKAFKVEFRHRRIDAPAPTVFKTQEIVFLKIGQRVVVEAVLNTAEMRPGIYELEVEVDPPDAKRPIGQVKEQNEANNLFIGGPLFIHGPDLVPTSLRFERLPLPPGEIPKVGQGEILEVIAEVANVGIEAAGAFKVTFSHRLAEKEEQITFDVVSFLGLGAGVSGPAKGRLDTFGLSPGFYEICVDVDPPAAGKPYGDVEEFEEGNNRLCMPLQVIAKPELKILRRMLAPPSPVIQGEMVKIFVEITNSGRAAAGAFYVEFALCLPRQPEKCEPFDLEPIPGLGVEELTVAIGELDTTQLIPGDYLIKVTVDPFKQVDELDETNNVATMPLEVLAKPDLELRKVSLVPPSPVVQGQMVEVIANVHNRGPGPVRRPFKVEFAIRRVDEDPNPNDFTTFATVELPGLEISVEVGVKAELDTTKLAPGNYELRVTVDPEDKIPEIDETNNQLFARLEILPKGKVDLKALNLILKPSALVMSGDIVTAVADVANVGEVPVGPFQVAFSYKPWGGSDKDKVRFAIVTVPGLKVGEQVTISAKLDTKGLASGNYEIIVEVDPEDKIKEVNETNNRLSTVLTII